MDRNQGPLPRLRVGSASIAPASRTSKSVRSNVRTPVFSGARFQKWTLDFFSNLPLAPSELASSAI